MKQWCPLYVYIYSHHANTFWYQKISFQILCDVPKSRLSAARLLTHWGRVTHICVRKIIIIGSDNGLSPDRRQAIIWTNAKILVIGPRGTNFSDILIGIQAFSFKKMHLKMSSAKWRPVCLDLNILTWFDLYLRVSASHKLIKNS